MKILHSDQNKEKKTNSLSSSKVNKPSISFFTEVPLPLEKAMAAFIENHPNWDQYRLMQAALSGFLLQNGSESRAINRIYCQNMFSKQSFGKKI